MSDLISRQAALDEAEEWLDCYYGDNYEEIRAGIKQVMRSLKKLPSVQPVDTISRQAAIDKFTSMPTIDGLGLQPLITVDDAVNTLEKLPSTQSEIGESLYRYKCYITDAEGLQHEVVHVEDIRRVTGWDI